MSLIGSCLSTARSGPLIGVLGGMGPMATSYFFARVTALADARSDHDHVPMLIESNPAVPDRTAYLLGRGPDPAPVLISMAKRLEAAGADLLVMACNTAYARAGVIAAAVEIPLLDWIDVAVDAVELQGRSVGLLVTNGTLHAGLYQRALAARGGTAIVPAAQEQAAVMDVIYQVCKAGGDPAEAVSRLQPVVRSLVRRGASAVLVGCTELSMLSVSLRAAVDGALVDGVDAVASEIIRYARGGAAARPARVVARDSAAPALEQQRLPT